MPMPPASSSATAAIAMFEKRLPIRNQAVPSSARVSAMRK